MPPRRCLGVSTVCWARMLSDRRAKGVSLSVCGGASTSTPHKNTGGKSEVGHRSHSLQHFKSHRSYTAVLRLKRPALKKRLLGANGEILPYAIAATARSVRLVVHLQSAERSSVCSACLRCDKSVGVG